MIIRAEDVARLERAAALATASVARALAEIAPRPAPTAAPLAGGQLVLLGPGMYVNRGLGMGLGVECTTGDLEALEAASESARVPAEVEVSPWAHPSLLERTAARGYAPVAFKSTLLRALPPEHQGGTDIVAVEEVTDAAGLAEWQAIAAAGFGYTTAEERRISDLYIAAVHSSDRSHLYIARIGDGAVGVAALTVGDDVGILGGMTTVPSGRGRGVQLELIRYRLAAAAGAGCRIAMSTAAPGSVSERNLIRRGFTVAYTTLTVRRPMSS